MDKKAKAEDAALRTNVFHRFPANRMRVAVGGAGPYLNDSDGHHILDGSSGAAVSSLGHAHPRVMAAMKRQIDTLAFAHTAFLTSEPAEALARELARLAPGDLSRTYFTAGGSEAVEAALKLARQYHVERGEPSRRQIISRRQSYHGNTLGALSAGGNLWRREMFEPLLIETVLVSSPYPYRDKAETETKEDYAIRLSHELETAIETEGAENIMCFIAETVSGATIGTVPPPATYLKRVREICDRYGILLILDEVMCGMGRTGTLFACEQEGVVPDIVTLAKGLGAGYVPIGAMMTTSHVFETVTSGSGFFQHGHTYTGHPLGCAAALEVLKVIAEDDLLSNVQRQSKTLRRVLREKFGQHPQVGEIRGRGLFMSLEFVLDRESKTPFPPERKIGATLKQAALEEDLICYPMSGLIDGKRGDHVMIAPPFIVNEAQIAEIADKLGTALEKVLARV